MISDEYLIAIVTAIVNLPFPARYLFFFSPTPNGGASYSLFLRSKMKPEVPVKCLAFQGEKKQNLFVYFLPLVLTRGKTEDKKARGN